MPEALSSRASRALVLAFGALGAIGALATIGTLGACTRPESRPAAAATASPAAAPDGTANDTIVARAPAGAPAAQFPAPTRPVSAIVSPRWSGEDERDDAGEAARVLDAGGVKAGETVADIGAGDGYYALRAATRVGPTGRVFAEDIVERYLELLHDRLREAPTTNVVLALGEPHDPRLPARSVDVALLVHMYHEITQPFGLLYNLAGAMRSGGRVVIVDQDGPTSAHGTPIRLLRCEMESMGYRWSRTDVLADGAYVALFTAPPSDSLTPPARVAGALAARGCSTLAR